MRATKDMSMFGRNETGTKLLRRTRRIRERTPWKVIRVSLYVLLIAGAAIGFGEGYLSRMGGHTSGFYWVSGEDWWAPNRGQCAWCGADLIPMVDEASACRHCRRCKVSFRHKSLPATLEEQEQVWK